MELSRVARAFSGQRGAGGVAGRRSVALGEREGSRDPLRPGVPARRELRGQAPIPSRQGVRAAERGRRLVARRGVLYEGRGTPGTQGLPRPGRLRHGQEALGRHRLQAAAPPGEPGGLRRRARHGGDHREGLLRGLEGSHALADAAPDLRASSGTKRRTYASGPSMCQPSGWSRQRPCTSGRYPPSR